jgi:hypothetical protein
MFPLSPGEAHLVTQSIILNSYRDTLVCPKARDGGLFRHKPRIASVRSSLAHNGRPCPEGNPGHGDCSPPQFSLRVTEILQ